MPKLPWLDKTVNHSPHVVLLGAGASLATFEKGDANGRILPLMNNLVEVTGLGKLLSKYGIKYEHKNFEEIFYDISQKKELESLTKEIEKKIIEYFSSLKIPEKPTIYDYLVLSLREKDVIATFNWDPLLLQAYARNSVIKKLPRLLFLHGNVGVGVCEKDKTLARIEFCICHHCGHKLQPTKLLYPIKKKDYDSDPIIKDQWDTLRKYLKHAYMFTIFGYSAPTIDEAAKQLMLEVWKKNESLELTEIEIIDIKSEEEIERTWKDFTFSHHYKIYKEFFWSHIAKFPRRSCDAFAQSSLMCKFLKDNQLPKFSTIDDLHKWINPLIDEEEKYEKDGTPFPFDGL